MKTMWSWRLPILTTSEANTSTKLVIKKVVQADGSISIVKKRKSETWHDKSRRHRDQKEQVSRTLNREKPPIGLPCTVILTRISPRCLDADDNLRVSMKWIKDAVADYLIPGKQPGRADDSKEIKWEYRQTKGLIKENGVIIELIKDDKTYC